MERLTNTHLGDHIFGIVPLMCGLLNGAGGMADGAEDPRLNIETSRPVGFFLISLEIWINSNNRYLRSTVHLVHELISATPLLIPTRNLGHPMLFMN